MKYSSSLVIVILHIQLSFKCIRTSSLEYDGALELKLEHTLDLDSYSLNPKFIERGNISVKTIRVGQTTVTQKQLNKDESLLLRHLAATNGYYKIRALMNGDEYKFISTVKACMLVEAKLDDRLSISLDFAGKVVAVSHILASKSACEGTSVDVDNLKCFITNVYVRHTEIGLIPDTASYIQRLEKEHEAKEKWDGKDNRSFLAKYWMYIVPVVIFMFISSAANADNTAGTE